MIANPIDMEHPTSAVVLRKAVIKTAGPIKSLIPSSSILTRVSQLVSSSRVQIISLYHRDLPIELILPFPFSLFLRTGLVKGRICCYNFFSLLGFGNT